MSFFLNGIHVPHRKNTAEQSAVRMTDVKSVTIPMQMHIGAPATPVVKVGDVVKVWVLGVDVPKKRISLTMRKEKVNYEKE